MGAYGPIFSAVKFGDFAMNKGLTLRMNQCPVKRQWPRLFSHIQNGYLKPNEHCTPTGFRWSTLPEGYHIFSSKLDNCIKPISHPPGELKRRSQSSWCTRADHPPTADSDELRARIPRVGRRPSIPRTVPRFPG